MPPVYTLNTPTTGPRPHTVNTLHTWLSTDTFSIQGSAGSVESVGGIATSTSWQWLKLGEGPSSLSRLSGGVKVHTLR